MILDTDLVTDTPGQAGEMTAAEVLAAADLPPDAAHDESVFFYDLFIAMAEALPRQREIPHQQWQAALEYRTLTPGEQAARERYFERKIRETRRKLTAAQ